MTPRPLSRSSNVAAVLLLCALILTARLLLGHAQMESAPTPNAAETPIEHPDGLPPVW